MSDQIADTNTDVLRDTRPLSGRENPHFKAREAETRTYLTADAPAILRLDGRAFHSYCRDLDRPYDVRFMDDMNATAIAPAKGIDGVRLAYVQSDEIRLLLMPAAVADPTAERGFMFAGSVQKLVSISAAIASTTLNTRRLGDVTDVVALFDSRAFSVADLDEAREYFAWRQLDARINSLSMLASAHFSHRELHGLSTRRRGELLREAGIDPSSLPAGFRDGRIVSSEARPDSSTFFDRRIGRERTVEFVRNVPVVVAAPDLASRGMFVDLVTGRDIAPS